MKTSLIIWIFALGLSCLSSFAKEMSIEAQAYTEILAKALKGEANAQYNLGVCYHEGRGVEKDMVKAAEWYRKAAEHGNAEAQLSLGKIYATGQGAQQDLAEGVKWFRSAAEKGHAGAQFMLGAVFYEGMGVEKDAAEAVKWYRKAAEQGDVMAQFGLGDCYQKGTGVTRDDAEVVKWWRKAAEQGYGMAQFVLAARYQNGQGVEKDPVEAYAWSDLAGKSDKQFEQIVASQEKNYSLEQVTKGKQRAAELGAQIEAKKKAALVPMTWTSKDGRMIQAKFVKLDGESVIIEKDGKAIALPFAKLSAESIVQAKRTGNPSTENPDTAGTSSVSPTVTQDEVGPLLTAVQNKMMNAKSLRMGMTFSYTQRRDGKQITLSGTVCIKGQDKWSCDFVMKGLSDESGAQPRFQAFCDGETLSMSGFNKKTAKAYLPDRFARQLREWCATSCFPLFWSILNKDIDQGDDNLPKVTNLKSLGKERLGETQAQVMQYILEYPTKTTLPVKSWIDPVNLRPLKREFTGPGLNVVETITSFEMNPEIPDSVFTTPVGTTK